MSTQLPQEEEEFYEAVHAGREHTGAVITAGYDPTGAHHHPGSTHYQKGMAFDVQIPGADAAAHERLRNYYLLRGYHAIVERPGDPEAAPGNQAPIVHVERRAPWGTAALLATQLAARIRAPAAASTTGAATAAAPAQQPTLSPQAHEEIKSWMVTNPGTPDVDTAAALRARHPGWELGALQRAIAAVAATPRIRTLHAQGPSAALAGRPGEPGLLATLAQVPGAARQVGGEVVEGAKLTGRAIGRTATQEARQAAAGIRETAAGLLTPEVRAHLLEDLETGSAGALTGVGRGLVNAATLGTRTIPLPAGVPEESAAIAEAGITPLLMLLSGQGELAALRQAGRIPQLARAGARVGEVVTGAEEALQARRLGRPALRAARVMGRMVGAPGLPASAAAGGTAQDIEPLVTRAMEPYKRQVAEIIKPEEHPDLYRLIADAPETLMMTPAGIAGFRASLVRDPIRTAVGFARPFVSPVQSWHEDPAGTLTMWLLVGGLEGLKGIRAVRSVYGGAGLQEAEQAMTAGNPELARRAVTQAPNFGGLTAEQQREIGEAVGRAIAERPAAVETKPQNAPGGEVVLPTPVPTRPEGRTPSAEPGVPAEVAAEGAAGTPEPVVVEPAVTPGEVPKSAVTPADEAGDLRRTAQTLRELAPSRTHPESYTRRAEQLEAAAEALDSAGVEVAPPHTDAEAPSVETPAAAPEPRNVPPGGELRTPTVPGGELPAAREPWEMTRGEFAASRNAIPGMEAPETVLAQSHEQAVRRALRDGEAVPAEVLAEYPELAAERPAAPAPEPPVVPEAPRETTIPSATAEHQAAEMRRTAGDLRVKSASVGRGFRQSYLKRAQQLEAAAEKLSPQPQPSLAAGGEPVPTGSRARRAYEARRAKDAKTATAPMGDLGENLRPALQTRKWYVDEQLRAEGIKLGTPEAAKRGAELSQVHGEAVRSALEAGQITPEQAVDAGHFVTHPELAKEFAVVSNEVGERIASREEAQKAEATAAEAEAGRKERVQRAHEYFASKRGQRGRAGMGNRLNPYAGREGSLYEDLANGWEIGKDIWLQMPGVRTFTEWSRQMVERVGEAIRPYLPRLWHDQVQDSLHDKFPDEMIQARAAEILPEIQPGERIRPGERVHAADRTNFGKVVSVDEQAGTARVHFVSPEGGEATVALPLDQLRNTRSAWDQALKELHRERGEQAYELALEGGSTAEATGDPAVKAFVREVVSPEQAQRMSEPTVKLLKWYQKLFTRELFHQDIALEMAAGRLKAILEEQGYDQELQGLAHDPAETLARAATAAGWKFRNAVTDGWFDASGQKTALGMDEIEHLAAFGSLPAEGVRGSAERMRRAIRPRQDRVERFWTYALALRARELWKKGIALPEGWTADEIEKVIEETETPEMQRAHAELQKWIHQSLLVLEENEWAEPGFAERMREEHPNYLPFVRETLEAAQASGAQMRGDKSVPALIQSIKGGRLLIRDPRSQLLSQTRGRLEVTHHWKSRAQLADWVEAARESDPKTVDQIARKLAPEELPGALTGAQAGHLADVLMQELVNPDGKAGPVTQAVAKAALTGTHLWAEGGGGKLPENVIPIRRGGTIEWWKVHPDLYEVYALRGNVVAPWVAQTLGALFGVPKRLLQATTTTYNALWIARNILRDIPDAIMQTSARFPKLREIRKLGPFNPEILRQTARAAQPLLDHLLPALKGVSLKTPQYRALGRVGAFQEGGGYRMEPGISGGFGNYEPGLAAKAGVGGRAALARMRRAVGRVPGGEAAASRARQAWDKSHAGDAAVTAGRALAYLAAKPFEVVARLGEIGEQMTRMAAARGEVGVRLGRGESLENAFAGGTREARQVTLPFERGGRAIKFLNRGAAFLSAGFQGVYTPFRQMKTDPVGTLIRGAVWVSLPAAFNYALNHDNPDWQRLSYFRKYGCITIPRGRDEKGETQWVWAPMPWTWGAVFGGGVVAGLESWKEHDPQAFRDWARQLISSTSPISQGAELMKAQTRPQMALELVTAAAEGVMPNALGTIWDLRTNKDWTGRDIVPTWDLEKHPTLWVKDYSSELARLAGRVGFSPLQVDYALDQTFGGLGRDWRAAADRALAETGHGTKPVAPSDQPMFLRSMVGKASQGASDAWKQDFYDLRTQLRSQQSLVEAKLEAKEPLTAEDRAVRIRSYRAENVGQKLSALAGRRQDVVRSTASRAGKQRQLDLLTAQETRVLGAFLKRPVPGWAEEKAPAD